MTQASSLPRELRVHQFLHILVIIVNLALIFLNHVDLLLATGTTCGRRLQTLLFSSYEHVSLRDVIAAITSPTFSHGGRDGPDPPTNRFLSVSIPTLVIVPFII